MKLTLNELTSEKRPLYPSNPQIVRLSRTRRAKNFYNANTLAATPLISSGRRFYFQKAITRFGENGFWPGLYPSAPEDYKPKENTLT